MKEDLIMAKKISSKRKVELLTLTDDALDAAVKIQGTQFDRKKKITPAVLKKMTSMREKDIPIVDIAKKLNLNYCTVRYNVDPEYRAKFNATRSGAHTGKTNITIKDRIANKRALVAAGKVNA